MDKGYHAPGLLLVLMATFALSGCGPRDHFSLADLGELYVVHEDNFAAIRARYPAPIETSDLIYLAPTPDRHMEGFPYIEDVSIPAKRNKIYLSPVYESSPSDIELSLWACCFPSGGIVIGAQYYHDKDWYVGWAKDPDTDFAERCDEEANRKVAALRRKTSTGSVYCKLSEHWYGYISFG